MFKEISSLMHASRDGLERVLLLALCAGVITLIASSPTYDVGSYTVGEVAKRTVSAPRDLVLEDSAGTEEKRRIAASQVRPVLVFSDSEATRPAAQLGRFFEAARGFSTEPETQEGLLSFNKEARVDLETQFRLDFVGREWDVVGDTSLWQPLTEAVAPVVEPLRMRGIVANKKVISNLIEETGATIVLQTTRAERQVAPDMEFYGLSEASQIIKEMLEANKDGRGPTFEAVAEKLSHLVLRPNVVFDGEETERRIAESRRTVEPIYYKIMQGEAVVRAGDVVTADQQQKLSRLHERESAATQVRSIASKFILTLLALVLLYVFAKDAWHSFRPTVRDLAVMACTLIGSFALLRLFATLAESVSLYAPDISATVLILAAPLAAGGILLQIILGVPGVFLFAASFSILASILLGASWELPLLIVLGNVVGALSIKSCHQRSAFIGAGIRVAATNVAIVGCYLMLDESLSAADMSTRLLCAVVGGLLSGVLGSALAPIAEHFGSYITDVKLLELSSLDNVLLRDLSVQAPGTWNHSMVMGQMAKAAAEAIGANALLARVGAYYHDIGKAKKPLYFVENQTTKDNRHDKLTPSMSALIIRSHVKDGIEMAKKAHLPQPIVDFIPQHHGTALIEYFFDKAKKEAEEGEIVDETHYRYPGPRPQTKEAGILMLADGVEAAARSVQDPSPAKLQGVVQKIINKIFSSGQLDECELTLKNLHEIAKCFTKILTAIHHRRVAYSEPAEKRARVQGDEQAPEATLKLAPVAAATSGEGTKDARRTNGETVSHGRVREGAGENEAESKSRETLKRLGM